MDVGETKQKQDEKIQSITQWPGEFFEGVQQVYVYIYMYIYIYSGKPLFWSLRESQSGWQEPSLAIQWNFPIYDLVFRKKNGPGDGQKL